MYWDLSGISLTEYMCSWESELWWLCYKDGRSGLVVTLSNMMVFINTIIIIMLKRLDADKLLSALKGTDGLKVPEFCTTSVFEYKSLATVELKPYSTERNVWKLPRLWCGTKPLLWRENPWNTHTQGLCSECSTSMQYMPYVKQYTIIIKYDFTTLHVNFSELLIQDGIKKG